MTNHLLKTKRIDEIGRIYSGSTPSTAKPSFWDGDIVWVTPSDLSKLKTPHLTTSIKKITLQGLENCSAVIVPVGSIIISSRAPIGYLAIASIECCTNQGCKSIALSSKYNSSYVYYNLVFNIDKVKNLGEGTTFAEISKTALSKVKIPFFLDTTVQTQIAAVLSTVDRAIAQTEALIAKQQRINTGLMQDLLTKGIDKNGDIRSETTHRFKDSSIGRIPIDWRTPELKKVSQVIDPNPTHRYPPSTEIGVPILSTENFHGENDYNLRDAQNVSFKAFQAQNNRCQYQENDIVFARKGKLGLARFYGTEKKVFSHTVVILKPFNTEELYPNYLLWLVRSWSFFNEINKRMNSNSGVPTLGVEFLGAVPIPIPPPLEQKQISNLLDSSERKIEAVQKQLIKLKRQKTGLMQDLLTDKVRVAPLLQK